MQARAVVVTRSPGHPGTSPEANRQTDRAGDAWPLPACLLPGELCCMAPGLPPYPPLASAPKAPSPSVSPSS